ncbi:hypothetical protein NX059_008292 [Plenodomus lindquistii]|nr:hypothetical protein NX059_008292 [Plenodomus lindquistii]
MTHHYDRQAPNTGSNGDYSHYGTTDAYNHHRRDADAHKLDNGQPLPRSQTPPQPLQNVIGNAFEKSDASKKVDPELIAHITAAVIDEIRSSGLATPASQTWPVPQQQQVPPSPASSIPARDVYTPPSPGHADSPSHPSPVRDPLSRDFDGNDDTPTPRCEKSALPQERASVRPRPPQRMVTDDYTPIEKMWQRLYSPEGQPLPRSGEFLRGLALHLIEDYEPKKSLVISPAKMLRFYDEVRIKHETYPWQSIFGELSYASLSKIYRDLRCQHHLIQEHPAEPPSIPALTPEGFEEWMTAMILAYPDVEYERLSKAVLDMPISNAEDRKERFPKELPRRLLPAVGNLQAQQRCAAALSAEGVGPLRRAPNFPPPPPKTQHATSVPNLERERSPYTARPDIRAFASEEEPESPSVPIERERKPYSSIPGTGKTYNDEPSRSTHSDTVAHAHRRRAQSTSNPPPFVPPPSDTNPYSRTQSNAFPMRPRSPGFSNYGTQSDSNIQDPNNYYTSNLHSFDDDQRRFSKDAGGNTFGLHRRSTAGIEGSFDSQPRSIYGDDDYRSRHGSSGYEGRGHDTRRY